MLEGEAWSVALWGKTQRSFLCGAARCHHSLVGVVFRAASESTKSTQKYYGVLLALL